MSEVVCPISCVKSGCDSPDFVEKHGAWLLTIFGGVGGLFSICFAFFLKSRCSKIKFGCLQCDRDVIPADQIEIDSNQIEVVSSM